MPAKPRRSISHARSSVCRRRPGTATREMAGRRSGISGRLKKGKRFSAKAQHQRGGRKEVGVQARSANVSRRRREEHEVVATLNTLSALHVLVGLMAASGRLRTLR